MIVADLPNEGERSGPEEEAAPAATASAQEGVRLSSTGPGPSGPAVPVPLPAHMPAAAVPAGPIVPSNGQIPAVAAGVAGAGGVSGGMHDEPGGKVS